MTSIKPPASGPQGPSQLDESSELTSADSNVNTPFANALDSARASAADGSHPTQPTGETSAVPQLAAQRTADPIGAMVQDVEAGRLGMDQALEQLVNQALDGVGKQLSGAERAELGGLLRDALAHDPTLRALRDE